MSISASNLGLGAPRKTTLAIATYAALTLALQYAPVPAPWRLRKLALADSLLAWHASREHNPADSIAPGARAAEHASRPAPGASPVVIVDAAGSMTHFYEALDRTERRLPGAVTRVLHYGDSPVTADSITADVRSLLQQKYGSAGHGFVLIAKPWVWYGHRGAELKARGWRISPATQARARDGIHGLGGVSFEGSAGAVSTVEMAEPETRVEVDYLQQPGGGAFRVSASDTLLGDVSTNGAAEQPGFASFPLPAGARSVSLAVTSGAVRLFGWTLESNGPGVIYHSLGLNGGQIQAVLRYFEPHQWAEQLRHQRPDLVVLNYGTNESVYPEYIERYYADELRQVIQRVRDALPETSVLIMSPMDRGERNSDGEIETVPILPRIVAIQRATAAANGCAFFDTFDAMGGAGTMARWYEEHPRLVSADFMHPLPAGAARVGALLDAAIERGFSGFKAQQASAPGDVAVRPAASGGSR